MISVGSGAKGILFNMCQVPGFLGKQYINGKRQTENLSKGAIFDQGVIVGLFGSGLTLKEFLVMLGKEERHFVTLH